MSKRMIKGFVLTLGAVALLTGIATLSMAEEVADVLKDVKINGIKLISLKKKSVQTALTWMWLSWCFKRRRLG